ncbi:hypothetical protein MMC12_005841 [Toensbergia leucococca]|nr:hypothetical protein [Toensbergia leucococca]
MKLAILSTILLPLVSLVHANPMPARNEIRQNTGFAPGVYFYGAAGAYYEINFPADNVPHHINNTLSVSSITLSGGATCFFTGANGSEVFLFGHASASVGPPQEQISGSCQAH